MILAVALMSTSCEKDSLTPEFTLNDLIGEWTMLSDGYEYDGILYNECSDISNSGIDAITTSGYCRIYLIIDSDGTGQIQDYCGNGGADHYDIDEIVVDEHLILSTGGHVLLDFKILSLENDNLVLELFSENIDENPPVGGKYYMEKQTP